MEKDKNYSDKSPERKSAIEWAWKQRNIKNWSKAKNSSNPKISRPIIEANNKNRPAYASAHFSDLDTYSVVNIYRNIK